MLQEKVIRMAFKRFHVVRVAGAKVVDADDKIALREQFVGQVKAEETGASGEQRDVARGGAHWCDGEW